MRFILTVLLITTISFLSFSDEITLKSGEIIKGKIISNNDSIIKIESEGINYSIKKDNIREINYTTISSEDSEDNENTDSDNENEKNETVKVQNSNNSESFKSNIFETYNNMLGAGFGFLIPGLILTFVPLIFGTPPIYIAINYNNALMYRDFLIPFSWYIGIMGVGVLLSGISIVFFIVAANLFNKYIKSNKVDLSYGSEKNTTYMALRIKF